MAMTGKRKTPQTRSKNGKTSAPAGVVSTAQDLWRSRIVGEGLVAAGDLRHNPRNPRRHPEAQKRAMAGMLDQVGWVQRCVVNRRTGFIVDGHLRADLAVERGETEVPVVYVDLSEDEEALVLAALDPLGAMAETDAGAMMALLQEAGAAGLALLSEARVPDDALRELLGGLALHAQADTDQKAGLTDVDQVPEPPDTPTTKRGDLWILGDHRLLCGDSGSPADLDRLLDGGPVHLLNTDPPYNVKVEPRSNNAIAAGLSSFQQQVKLDTGRDLCRHPEKSKPTHRKMRAKDRPLENDFVTDEAFAAMLKAWFGNAARVLLPGRGFFIWGGYSNIANYPLALVEAGLYFSQTVIWVKEHPVLTRKDFMGNHEWAFYGWREGAAHYFNPEIKNATDVWTVKKVSPQKMVHLTEKPVELATRAMNYCSRPGETVLDLFGGSGSTLIGAEQVGRRARLMELDPAYCDVIVQRFEQFTGKKAERATP